MIISRPDEHDISPFGVPEEIWYDDDFEEPQNELINILPQLLPNVFNMRNRIYFYDQFPGIMDDWRSRHGHDDDYFPDVAWTVENCCLKFRTKNSTDVIEYLSELDHHISHCRKCKKNRDFIAIHAIFPE